MKLHMQSDEWLLAEQLVHKPSKQFIRSHKVVVSSDSRSDFSRKEDFPLSKFVHYLSTNIHLQCIDV